LHTLFEKSEHLGNGNFVQSVSGKGTKFTQRFLGGICLLMCAGILLAGFWPRHFQSANQVSWLEDQKGIEIHAKYYKLGIIYSPDPLAVPAELSQQGGITLELWLESKFKRRNHLGYILSLYAGKDTELLVLGQWRSSLIVRSRDITPKGRINHRNISLRNALPVGQRRFLTLVSSREGTRIYLNGKLAQSYPGSPMSLPGNTTPVQLVLGIAPTGDYRWSGNLLGLAIYNKGLPANQVLEHYQEWTRGRWKRFRTDDGLVVLYPFNERGGQWVHDRASRENNLLIPSTFVVLEKEILAPFWRNFALSRCSVKDIVLNVFGFIPLGFCLAAYLCKAGTFSQHLIYALAIMLGGCLSLTIELFQIYLPLRSSSLLDLILNILGTGLGVILLHIFSLYLRPPKRFLYQ
jgi:hypothetical protein